MESKQQEYADVNLCGILRGRTCVVCISVDSLSYLVFRSIQYIDSSPTEADEVDRSGCKCWIRLRYILEARTMMCTELIWY